MSNQIRRVWARITEKDFRDIKTEACFLQMPLQDLLGELICKEVDEFNKIKFKKPYQGETIQFTKTIPKKWKEWKEWKERI